MRLRSYDASLDMFDMFMSKAKAGNLDAMCQIGYFYKIGMMVRSDRDAAMDWYTKAAKAGSTRGMISLAAIYSDAGEYGLAKRWWGDAAAAGDPGGYHGLAMISYHGRLGMKNMGEAIDCLERPHLVDTPSPCRCLPFYTSRGMACQRTKL